MVEFSGIPEILQDLKQGKMIVLVDDEDRENEGDLVAAAECITPETVNFMASFGRGLICVPLTLRGKGLGVARIFPTGTQGVSAHTAEMLTSVLWVREVKISITGNSRR